MIDLRLIHNDGTIADHMPERILIKNGMLYFSVWGIKISDCKEIHITESRNVDDDED